MSAGYYCPKPGCHWEALAMPPGRVCPHCGFAVAAYSKKTEEVQATAEANDAPALTLTQPPAPAVTDQEACEGYTEFAIALGRMLIEKQRAYGNSFGKAGDVLKLLYPHGITVEQYGDLLTITRIIDKLFRVANQKHYGGESPYRDIAGYAIMAACEDERGVASTPKSSGQQEPIELT